MYTDISIWKVPFCVSRPPVLEECRYLEFFQSHFAAAWIFLRCDKKKTTETRGVLSSDLNTIWSEFLTFIVKCLVMVSELFCCLPQGSLEKQSLLRSDFTLCIVLWALSFLLLRTVATPGVSTWTGCQLKNNWIFYWRIKAFFVTVSDLVTAFAQWLGLLCCKFSGHQGILKTRKKTYLFFQALMSIVRIMESGLHCSSLQDILLNFTVYNFIWWYVSSQKAPTNRCWCTPTCVHWGYRNSRFCPNIQMNRCLKHSLIKLAIAQHAAFGSVETAINFPSQYWLWL